VILSVRSLQFFVSSLLAQIKLSPYPWSHVETCTTAYRLLERALRCKTTRPCWSPPPPPPIGDSFASLFSSSNLFRGCLGGGGGEAASSFTGLRRIVFAGGFKQIHSPPLSRPPPQTRNLMALVSDEPRV
jgi:hypothetical protein